jgi:WD40 repeat protein
VVGTLAYAGGKDGTVTVLDVETGEVLWEWSPRQRTTQGFLRGMMWPPVVVGDRLYTASLDGHLYAFRGQRDAAAFARWREEQAAQRRLLAGMVGEGGVTPTAAEVDAVRELGRRVPGFVVWESNRTGQWELYRIDTDGSGFRQLTRLAKPGDPLAFDEPLRPRVSPDGKTVLFAYGRKSGPIQTWVVPADGGEPRKRIDGHPLNWSADGHSILFVRDRQLWRHDWDTGQEAAVHAAQLPAIDRGMVGSARADLKAVMMRTPAANEYFVLDEGKTMKTRGGCESRFSEDGRYAYWVQGPKDFRVWDIAHNKEWQILGEPPTNPHNYTYFPTVSADNRWLVYGASPNQHDHDTSDYEVFIVELQNWKAVGQPVRLSWHPRTDRWPALWVKK